MYTHACRFVAHPLFNCTAKFAKCLEVFQTCHHSPRIDHPVVKAWFQELGGSFAVLSSAFTSATNTISSAASNSTAYSQKMTPGQEKNKVTVTLKDVGRARSIMGQS